MKSGNNKTGNRGEIFRSFRFAAISFAVVCVFLLSFVLIRYFSYSKIAEDDLEYVTDTYDSYSKGKIYYKIKCLDNTYEILILLIDKEDLDGLKANDELSLGIVGEGEIVAVSVNGEPRLTLEDCLQKIKDNTVSSLIIIPSIYTGILLGIIGFYYFINRFIYRKYSSLKTDAYACRRIIDSVKLGNGKYYCDILENLPDSGDDSALVRAMLDTIDEDRVYLMFDKNDSAETSAFIFYRLGKKLYYEFLVRHDNEPFEIFLDSFCWLNPVEFPSKNEKGQYEVALRELLNTYPELIKIENSFKAKNRKRKQ